jgi:GGDEF domain-containing protein
MELPIMVGDVVVRIDAAIGFTLSEPGEHDVDEVLRRADEEMYRIKRAGKANPVGEAACAAPAPCPHCGVSPAV